MKKLLILVLLSSFAFAQCQDYIKLAEERLAPPYPNYFGAANEYIHAAECYEKQGDFHIADSFYEKAANHYIIAAELLVEGGDFYQKAKSYEFAADSYSRIGQTEASIEYYDKAREIYLKYGYIDEANALTGATTAVSAEEFEFNPWLYGGLILLVLFIIIVFLYASKRGRGGEIIKFAGDFDDKKSSPPKEPLMRQIKTSDIVKNEEFRAPRPVLPREEGPKPLSPKEKLAKKLREKYTPK